MFIYCAPIIRQHCVSKIILLSNQSQNSPHFGCKNANVLILKVKSAFVGSEVTSKKKNNMQR